MPSEKPHSNFSSIYSLKDWIMFSLNTVFKHYFVRLSFETQMEIVCRVIAESHKMFESSHNAPRNKMGGNSEIFKDRMSASNMIEAKSFCMPRKTFSVALTTRIRGYHFRNVFFVIWKSLSIISGGIPNLDHIFTEK